ncbi:MAG: hypothetical protein K0S00_2250 [Xanthobacteraceae bacterium]|jgi:hypothetical protein|nr:hypothetical protein [Xanthobacteraceae bacterium]
MRKNNLSHKTTFLMLRCRPAGRSRSTQAASLMDGRGTPYLPSALHSGKTASLEQPRESRAVTPASVRRCTATPAALRISGKALLASGLLLLSRP